MVQVPEPAADTEAQQILNQLAAVNARLDGHAAAINGIGENIQWLVDNVKGIFQMFSNPMFMQQMMSSMSGMAPKQEETTDG